MVLSKGSKRLLVIAAVCLVIYALVGFLIAPPIVRAQAERRLSATLGRTVTIGKVRLNPFALSVSVEDFDIRERDGATSFAGWRRFYARFDALRSLGGDWVLGDVELEGFHAALDVNPNGSFNFSDLLAAFAPPPGTQAQHAKPGRALRVSGLGVADARVAFTDHSLRHAFTTVFGPLTFAVSDFRTLGDRGAPYHFEAATEAGERLAWSGTLAADPLESSGEFSVDGLVLPKYSPYLEGRIRAVLTQGTLSLRGRYEARFDPKARVMKLEGTEVHLGGLAVAERAGGKTAVTIKSVDVTGIEADADANRASVGRVGVSGGQISLRREKGGSLNLLDMLSPDAASAPAGAPATAPSAPAPDVRVAEIAVDGLGIDVTDESLPHPSHLGLSDVALSIRNFSTAGGAEMPLALSFGWAPSGKVRLDGSVALKPVIRASLKADVDNLAVLPLSPYLEQFVNARVTKGSVFASTSVRASIPDGRPSVELAGDIRVDGFGIVDTASDKDLVGFTRLSLSGIDVATDPELSASVKRVEVAEPYARVRVNADKSINVTSLLAKSAPDAPSAKPAPAAPMPGIQVGSVEITGGDFSFSDRSVEPNVRVSLGNFGGTISGLSSRNLARATVDLKGMVGGSGPVAISGSFDLLGAHKFAGLKITVRNADLLPLSPYSGRYAGYEIARGQLVVDSDIDLDGDRLDMKDVTTLNQFTFGSATSSPEATGLPVRLGVALLKDTDGRIVIDLPVQGTLGDPNFRIGKVVLRIVVNLLTKAAISPFSLIGSMFGGGGDELAFQEFAPGSFALEPSELPKLDTVAKALANRPALSLGIEGAYDPAADAYALKRQKLVSMVRAKVWEERHAADPNIAPPDKLSIPDADYAAMVKRLFDQKFPPGTQFGTPLPPPPAPVRPPEPPPPGPLMRLVNLVTFKKARDERAARKENERLEAEHAADVARAAAAGLPLDQMAGRLAETIDISVNDLRGLAAARAQSVRDHLMGASHISAERLFLQQGATGQGKGPRALLSLQ